MATLTALDPLLVAEDASAYLPPWPTEVLADLGDVVLKQGRTSYYGESAAFRIRFERSAADRRIDEVRTWMAERGRSAFMWWIGASTEPDDLERRLLDLGARLEPEDPIQTPMLLDHEPPPGPEGIDVRPVASIEDYGRCREIISEAFGMPEQVREEMRALLAEEWELAQADPHLRFMALIDGEPVAYAILARLTMGPPYLGGGATIPWAQGRGAYRALVRARWDAAVALGMPALIIQAGKNSRPILERLGFRSGPPIHLLVQDSGLTTS